MRKKRFVAIVVILVMGLLGQVAPFVWQPVSAGITALGTLIAAPDHWASSSLDS